MGMYIRYGLGTATALERWPVKANNDDIFKPIIQKNPDTKPLLLIPNKKNI